jgi:predicted Zn-dependent protease with MMP-like domain
MARYAGRIARAGPDNGRMPSEMDLPGESEAADPPAAEGRPDPFEALVAAALESLPDVFRRRLGSVAIVIEDEPTAEQLESVGAPGLFGLYTGVPRTAYGADQIMVASKITIFRGAHLRAYRDPYSLARGVADTVRHEIAHHFGISDARLDELARERSRRGSP